MTIEKARKLGWLDIASILWGAVGVLLIVPAVTVFGIFWVFSEGLSPNEGANITFSFSIISFPFVCLASSAGIQLLKNRHREWAYSVVLLPLIPLILIFVGNRWMSLASCGRSDCSNPTMQEQGNTTNASECALPALDGGDSLETTGCGGLKVGVIVTGITSNTTEAHNWQFSA